MYAAFTATFPDALYVATIVLFALLTPPTIYVWRKHGVHGFLAYNFVFAVCAIKIVGSALTLATPSHPNSGFGTTAAILNSMAISPLILAALSSFQEARQARRVMSQERQERIFVILLHGLVIAGLVLIIVGLVHIIQNPTSTSTSTDESYIKAGLALLAVSWALVCAATLYSLRFSAADTFPSGVKLLYAVLLSLPFIGIRLVYGILDFLLTNPSFAQSLGAKVVLGLIPEFLAVAVFVVAGIITRDMWREDHKEPEPVKSRELVYTSYPKYNSQGEPRRHHRTGSAF